MSGRNYHVVDDPDHRGGYDLIQGHLDEEANAEAHNWSHMKKIIGERIYSYLKNRPAGVDIDKAFQYFFQEETGFVNQNRHLFAYLFEGNPEKEQEYKNRLMDEYRADLKNIKEAEAVTKKSREFETPRGGYWRVGAERGGPARGRTLSDRAPRVPVRQSPRTHASSQDRSRSPQGRTSGKSGPMGSQYDVNFHKLDFGEMYGMKRARDLVQTASKRAMETMRNMNVLKKKDDKKQNQPPQLYNV